MEELAAHGVGFTLDEGIAQLRLNRPAKANSITMAMLETIVETLDTLANTPSLKALVLTAEGRNFCGGVDLAVMDPQMTPADELTRYYALWDKMIEGFQNLAVPVIAAIQGPAIAGGLSIALACDIRIASEGAAFGYPRIPQGHAPGQHNLTQLVRRIGPGRARLVFLGARIVSAREAYEWGLADLMVENDELTAALQNLLDAISTTPGNLVSLTHMLIERPDDDTLWDEAALI